MKQWQREDDITEEEHRRSGDVDGASLLCPGAKTTGHQVGFPIFLSHDLKSDSQFLASYVLLRHWWNLYNKLAIVG